MELYVRIFILCLLCIARASEVQPEEIAELRAGFSTYEDLSRIPIQETDGTDRKSMEIPRDKRALGLLLSGLAQIFGYTVTPIQFASLPNTNVTTPAAAMSNLSKTVNVKQQTAASRFTNTTVPKQQETIRFTGVLNFGNNSDIIGHLQRYEQIFHGRNNTTTTMTTASRPSISSAKISIDPSTNSQTKPPLLAPFFVKIPLPIAPELLSATLPIEDLGLSHPSPSISITSGSNENMETPVRKEQETIYRSNEDTERFTVKEKEIYDEKDVKKPMDEYNHQLNVDKPRQNKQQNDRYNELQRKQEERIKKLEQQEKERTREKVAHYNEEEMNERYRNREKEIDGRNRDYGSKHESTEERKPAHDDEEDESSAERYKEYASQENLSNESSRQSSKEREQSEDYDDESKQPEDFDKYVEVRYNQQLPIGDYFHEGNPEMIRDSYGEVLDSKKLEDDRIAGYISMFKHPYVQVDAYNTQRAPPEDASREENEKETSADDGYDEHLIRLQKLREEYALPENKYEEYDLSDESEADGNDDRENDKLQNRTSVRSRRPKTGRDNDDDRTRRPTGLSRDDVARLENAKSQEEVDFTRYVPLVVPVRYIDANDKVQQASTKQLNYKEIDKSTDSRFSDDNVGSTQTVFKENLIPQIGLPERPRQLHEGEQKELQVWPPPFDYVFDNTEPANTIIQPNPQNYAPNYYQHVVKDIAAQDAKSSEQPSGYLVVVGNPLHPYRYPYNIYYFSNEAVSSPSPQAPPLNAEVTHPRDQVYVAQQSTNQQVIQAKSNITESNLNETTNSPRDYFYRSQVVPASVLDRYKYNLEGRTPQVKEPFDIEIKSQIPNTENWSNRIYPIPSNTAEQYPRPVFAQLQNIVTSNQNAQREPPERPRYSRLLRRRKNLQSKDHHEDVKKTTTPQPILKNKPFDDPQSAHDFFDFSKDDYNFGSKSSDATKVTEENGKTTEESDVFVAPEPTAYHHDDESIVKHTDEPENDTEKAKVREYRNKAATLRVSERRQLKPNGPVYYVDFIHNL